MTHDLADESWFTPELAHADREADWFVERAATAIRESEAVVEEVMADLDPPTEEEVERFRTTVMGYARTPEWEAVAERVAAGELSWARIANGECMSDPGVVAAFSSMSDAPPPGDDDLARYVGPNTGSEPAQEQDGEQPRATSEDLEDDEYFSGGHYLRPPEQAPNAPSAPAPAADDEDDLDDDEYFGGGHFLR